MSADNEEKGLLKVPSPAGLAPLKKSYPQNVNLVPTGSATGNPRNKVALRPGYSLMDWIRLTKSGQDLTGVGGKLLQVTPSELAKHNKRKDAWMAINGVVYNVTAYMDYHPGGWDELVKGAGRDATNLFNEIHRWVNYDSMLSACIVGKLVQDYLGKKTPSSKMMPPSAVIPPIVGNPGPEKPKLDWHQTSASLTLSIYTRRKQMMLPEHVVVDYNREHKLIHVLVFFPDDDTAFNLAYNLEKELDAGDPLTVVVSQGSGKVEVSLRKKESEKWNRIGRPLVGNETWVPIDQLPTVDPEDFPLYRPWRLVSRVRVTNDVDHYVLEPPHKGLHLFVPCGHHVKLLMNIEGIDIIRSYTPTFKDLRLDAYDDEQTRFDKNLHFLIKSYPMGTLTPLLKQIPIGSNLMVSNHCGSFKSSALKNVSKVIILAAGTGITPMLKLIQSIFYQCIKEKTLRKVLLLFFNKTEEDIIWGSDLDVVMAKSRVEEFFSIDVHHILSQDEDWSGHKGRVSHELLARLVHPKQESERRLACICGPIPFTKDSYNLLQESCGFEPEEIIKFEG